jgi:selenocysteine-specific translation elongation factor
MRSDSLQCAGGQPVGKAPFAPETLPADELGLSAIPPTPSDIEALIRIATAAIKPRENNFTVKMEHHLHAGMYARTCRVPSLQKFTSVLFKIPTLLVVHGDCLVTVGAEWKRLRGYNVIPASAQRILAYITIGDTEITMIFPSNAQTVEEAEAEFTDESADLLSRRVE